MQEGEEIPSIPGKTIKTTKVNGQTLDYKPQNYKARPQLRFGIWGLTLCVVTFQVEFYPAPASEYR